MKRILQFFDKLEDRVRHKLSRYPIIYAFIGGAGVIIFWRGVWHLNDYIISRFMISSNGTSAYGSLTWWDGVASIIAGGSLLLVTGILVPSFVGNEVIISGLRREKKIAERTEEEVETELEKIKDVQREIRHLSEDISKIKRNISRK